MRLVLRAFVTKASLSLVLAALWTVSKYARNTLLYVQTYSDNQTNRQSTPSTVLIPPSQGAMFRGPGITSPGMQSPITNHVHR